MTRIQQLNPKTGEVKPYYSLTAAYLIWLLLGLLGGHWFYLGRPGRGVIYFCTAGYLGVGWVIDGINLPDYVRLRNEQS